MLWYVLHNPDNDNQPRFLAPEIVIFDKIFRHCLFALGGRTPLLPMPDEVFTK